ncbi:MAG: hypothetical protein AAGA86_13255 [Bacteroidota bacterium]
MRKIMSVVVLGLLMACGQKAEKKETGQPMETEPATTEWLTFKGDNAQGKKVVLISGDEEYRSEEALTQLAKILSSHYGFQCTVLYAQDPEKPGIINPNFKTHIPNLESLEKADLMVLFTRFRALPNSEMHYIDDYLKQGKPVVGIRTATHAFNFGKDSLTDYGHYGNGYKGDITEWKDGFGRLVLGEKWHTHHGHHKHQSTRGILPGDKSAITQGIGNGEIWGSTDVYGVRLPLPGDSKAVVLGQVINREGDFMEDDIFYGMKSTDAEVAEVNNKGQRVNDTLMPIAWTKSYQLPGGKKGKAFTSTIGSSSDLLNEGVRRLLINGAFWVMGMPIPEKSNVDLVGDYNPSAYGFKPNEFWTNKQLQVTDLK